MAEQSELQPRTGDVWDDVHKIPTMRKGGGSGGGGVMTRVVQASLVLKQWEKHKLMEKLKAKVGIFRSIICDDD